MSNAITTPAEPTQTEVDIQHLITIIENNLGDGSRSLPKAGRIRIKSALETVLSRRDEESARLKKALEYANTGLFQAEMIVSDESGGGRGSGSSLPSWDAEDATKYLVDAQANVNAALRGEEPAAPAETDAVVQSE